MTEAAEKYINRLYLGGEYKLASTDPEFSEFFTNFSCDEVVSQDDLDGPYKDDGKSCQPLLDVRESMNSEKSFRGR